MPTASKGSIIPNELHHHRFPAMGTVCDVHVRARHAAEAALAFAAVVSEVDRIEEKYSRYRETSFLSQINRAAAAGETMEIDRETADLLGFAQVCFHKSDGLFDITSGVLRHAWDFKSGRLPDAALISSLMANIGMDRLTLCGTTLGFSSAGTELDLGGIGKEYAVDRAIDVVKDIGIASGMINFGGDVSAFDESPGPTPWSVGIRDPRHPDSLIGAVSLRNGALATSGDYERNIPLDGVRYSHILNPRTGWPVRGLASVSVLAPNCMIAGSIATLAMLKGRSAIEWLAETNVDHLWVDDEGRRGGTLPSAPH